MKKAIIVLLTLLVVSCGNDSSDVEPQIDPDCLQLTTVVDKEVEYFHLKRSNPDVDHDFASFGESTLITITS